MGGVITKATDVVVDNLCSCFCLEVHHICRLDKNLETLAQDMRILVARRDDVQKLVKREEDRGLQRLSGVDVWLTAVGNIENQSRETLVACVSELQELSLCDGCSRKLVARFWYGKKVFSMLEEVKELTGRKLTEDINAMAVPPMRAVVGERDVEPIIVGQETLLEKAWSRLMDEGTQVMGIHGMGGVGKTTLLDQINNKFCGANDGVDIVIWVVVSKVKRNEKIQDEIAEKLGLEGELWKQKTEVQKASTLRTCLKNKRFVLLLDDIWSKVELKVIGVPIPTRENKCKIVFTTRSREVCVHMGDIKPVKVSCLDTDKAWELFKEKVGENILESHQGISELAKKVAEKCDGLPLALNVLGETMSSKDTIHEWRDAVEILNTNAANFSGMDDKILPVLMYSYDSLIKEHVKSCFLYCSLFPEDFEIRKERLIEYWICEGLLQEKQSTEKAFDEGYSIISILVRACLLLEEPTYKLRVQMHDVVREMALWVASDLGEHEGRYTVQAGVGLREIPEVESWGPVRKMSLMDNEIKELSGSPCCPELTTLILQRNKLVTISSEFFQQMPRLLVLDLSRNWDFNVLPEKMSLVALRYLDLSGTKIERLPVGLQESRMLIYLNLELTKRLDNVSGISKFSRLRRLVLQHSKTKLDMSLLEELQLFKYLQAVTISISSCLVAERLSSYDRVVKCIEKLHYEELQEESFRVLTLPNMVNLRDLGIDRCGMMEIKTEGGATSSCNKSPMSPSFLNLSNVFITNCNGLKDLTWLLFAPNLKLLHVGDSTQIEYIISQEKATNGVTGTIIRFANLEYLEFDYVPMLKSIYWSSLSFPCLKRIRVRGCPNLRKLPLDSKSAAKVEGFC